MQLIRVLRVTACAAISALSVCQAVLGDDFKRPKPAAIALACGGCHGTYGQGMGSIPAIRGIPESEFIRAMQDFQSSSRSATVMDRIARGYQHQDFVGLARFFRNR
ncbi:cytochrome c class I [Methylocaldum marinum]|uniref:Cytochrome c class I n=1 Tax=Methylocaldum marinum TaxID=1432792 RepID=A0A250KQD5_9GAMM|nr:cytochrome c class I [Methylocaldum marinum]